MLKPKRQPEVTQVPECPLYGHEWPSAGAAKLERNHSSVSRMSHSNRWKSCLIILAMCTSLTYAKEVSLFEKGRGQVLDYDRRLASLEPGDTLVFEDGNRFVYRRKLGSGSTTLVLEVLRVGEENPTALRVPIRQDYIGSTETPIVDYISMFIDGAKHLAPTGVIPELKRSSAGQYVQVEKIDWKFSFSDFLASSPKIPREEHRRMKQSFLNDFAPRFATIFSTGDMRPDQFVWDGKRWILLDFARVEVVGEEVDPMELRWLHPFGESNLDDGNKKVFRKASKLFKKAGEAIYLARLQMVASGRNPISLAPLRVVAEDWRDEKALARDLRALRNPNSPNRILDFCSRTFEALLGN